MFSCLEETNSFKEPQKCSFSTLVAALTNFLLLLSSTVRVAQLKKKKKKFVSFHWGFHQCENANIKEKYSYRYGCWCSKMPADAMSWDMIFFHFKWNWIINGKIKQTKTKPNPIWRVKHSFVLYHFLEWSPGATTNGSACFRSWKVSSELFSNTVRHSNPVRNAPIYPDYSAQPLNQPNLISSTVNHLDVVFPVWLWIYSNERGSRHCKGNSCDRSGHGAQTQICKAKIYSHSEIWKKTHAVCTNCAPRAPLKLTKFNQCNQWAMSMIYCTTCLQWILYLWRTFMMPNHLTV